MMAVSRHPYIYRLKQKQLFSSVFWNLLTYTTTEQVSQRKCY